jgi:hypothetical protein
MTERSGVEVCELLPDKFKQLDETLQKEAAADENASGWPGVPDFVWKMVASEAQQGIHDALHTDVFSVVARGWCLAQELRKYKDADQYPPDQTFIVFLGEHGTATELHPTVKIRIGEIRVHPIRFTLALSANFRSAALLIKTGCIIGAASGDCQVSAQLKYGDIALHEPLESRHVVLPGRVAFDAPGLAIG